MRAETQHAQTIRVQFWVKSPIYDIDTLAERERARGNQVLEVHKDCNCRGAGANVFDGDADRDDHLLVLDAERTR